MTNTSSFEDFVKKSKSKIDKLNAGKSNALLQEVHKEIKSEKELLNHIASQNYIELYKQFVNNLSEHYIGKMLSFDYHKTQIITNDEFLLKQKGVPRASFLVATLKDFSILDGIEHFILLFVNNFSKLEDNQEQQVDLIKHYKMINLSDGDINLTNVPQDILNREQIINDKQFNNMKFVGVDCQIMGMFYKNSDFTFDFSSQVNFILSPNNYVIAKPNKEIRNIIANHKTILNATNTVNAKINQGNSKEYIPYAIGLFDETESNVFTDQEKNPDVYLDLDVFRCKRTAFFGKTRLGKSNTVKHIVSLFLSDNARKSNTDLKNKTGFVIFDENGEYANANSQDGTSLYEKHKDSQTDDGKKIVKRYTLNKNKNGNLMLNFYINPQETMSLFNQLMSKDKSIYLESFLNIDLPYMNHIIESYVTMGRSVDINKNDLFKLQLFWALLNKCGFKYSFNETKKEKASHFFNLITKIIEHPFKLSEHIYQDLQNVYKEHPDLYDMHELERYSYQENDDNEKKFHQMCNLIDLFVDIRIHHPDYLIEKTDKRKYLIYDALLEMFNTTNKAGYKTLRKFIDFHSEKSDNQIDEVILDVCDNAITAIIDLSTVTNSDVKRYYAERLVSYIFNKKVQIFIKNETNEKPYVIFHFEEAHNLFPTESGGNVYYKLAKEGAKYNIGIMYATQSPSNIFSELLTQTENFFIGHLSSPKEVSSLTSLSFAFQHLAHDLMNIKKIGYQRVLTDNHRYPIPVQIHKFEN